MYAGVMEFVPGLVSDGGERDETSSSKSASSWLIGDLPFGEKYSWLMVKRAHQGRTPNDLVGKSTRLM